MGVTRRVIAVIAVAVLLAGACGGGSGGDSSDNANASETSSSAGADGDGSTEVTGDELLIVGGEVDVDALNALVTDFIALDPEQQRARVNELSGELERQLYDLSGLTEMLGDPETADESVTQAAGWFAELADQVSTGAASAQLEPQGLRRAAPAQTGTPSIGEGFFGGVLATTMGAEGAVTSTNDVTKAAGEIAKGVNIKATADSVELTVNGSFTDSTGVTTTLKSRNVITPCPGPDGTFKASATIDVSSTVNNGSTGKRGTFDVTINGTVDDDANLVGYDVTSRGQYADFAAGRGGYIDVTTTRTQAAGSTMTVNRTGGKVTTEIEQNASSLSALASMLVGDALANAAKKGWESGRCVELKPTVSAGPSGLKPSESVTVTAAPRSKIDSGPVGGSVKAQLTGGATSVEPSGTKVRADATFTYVAPDEQGKTGTVSLEARSKRGIAKATIGFDTAAAPTVRIAGPVTFSLMGAEGTAIVDLTLTPDPDGAYTGTANAQITGALNAMQTTCTSATWTESIDLMATLATENDEQVLIISTIGEPPRGTPVATKCTTAGIEVQSRSSLISSSLFGEVRIRPVNGDQAFIDTIAPGTVAGTVNVTVT